MSDHNEPVELLHRIIDEYGSSIELTGEQGELLQYTVVQEFKQKGQSYVALQTKEMKKQHEVDFFKVIEHQGELEIVTIDDDDEWEFVSETYDDIIFTQMKFPD
ncbi:DUF1292 domain-containing protein [Paenibacillus yanchengensis]|uniref:DUF1292 domain-containing protein n=1 Tax=Paenibacillus yanchengensis TaxID=2035833 RepID=A0ABW4YL15_9BACL